MLSRGLYVINGLIIMVRKFRVAFSAMLMLIAGVFSLSARQSVGLVLSGGGAKGIAEIGAIEALEENDIPIDYITGTSMGAIVGALYACGYSPAEMMELICSPSFSSWSTGKIDPSQRYFFNNPVITPDILTVNLLSRQDSTRSMLPSSLISPLPMNFAFMELFAAYTAQCGSDFNNLFVPFRCVTSDVYEKHKVVLSKGDLGESVRASMSFPSVFQPIMIDGFLAFDGGLYDNFPVDVMEEDFCPDIIIGVDVSGPNSRPPEYDLFKQLEDMVMQKSDYNVPPHRGIRIKIDPDGTTLLDFPMARSIYKRGYDKTMEMIDSIKKRVTGREAQSDVKARRAQFKKATPRVVFDKVNVRGGTPTQNEFIEYIFTENRTDTFGLAHAKDAYFKAVTSGRLRNLVPRAVYDDSTGMSALDMKATVKNNFHLGLGGYITSSVNSMLYLSASYSTLSFNSIEATVSGWLGQSYMAAEARARLYLRTHVPSALNIQAVVSRTRQHQNDNVFFKDREPVFITDFEAFGRLGYELAAGNAGDASVFGGYGYLNDSYSSTGSDVLVGSDRDRLRHYLGQVGVKAEFYTLNSKMFATSGHHYLFKAMGVMGKYDLFDQTGQCDIRNNEVRWLQLEADVEKIWDLGKHFSLGVNGNLMASTRGLLPDYNASLVSAFAFHPTASSHNAFYSSMRAMSYVAAGITPIVKFTDAFQLRATAQYFMPFRVIVPNADLTASFGRWFRNPKLFAEVSLAYVFPFASLSGYVNYVDSAGSKWNCGLAFGWYFTAPRFLR